MTLTRTQTRNQARRVPHKLQIQANAEVLMYCPGSLTAPRIENGKPHCKICGEAFGWQEMVNQIRDVPEH